MTDLRNQHKNRSTKKPPNIKTRETTDNANQVAAQLSDLLSTSGQIN